MKKTFGFLVDSFLLIFLLVIFIVPVIVSFNLDPQLLQNSSTSVAGVSDFSGNEEVLNFQVNTAGSLRAKVEQSKVKGNSMTIRYSIQKGGILNEEISVGKVVNNGKEGVRIQASVLIDEKRIKETRAYLLIREEKYRLLNETEELGKEFSINPGEEIYPKLVLESDVPLNFSRDLVLEIKGLID